MVKTGGFIVLHRKMLEWEWYRNPNTLCLFVHLLLVANHESRRFEGMVISRGQLVTSLSSLSADTGLSFQQTRTALEHLISTGEVTNKSYTKYRVITITNYDLYQDKQQAKQQTNNKQITSISTNEQQTSNNKQQYNNGNNITNINKDKSINRFVAPTLEEVTMYCKEIGSEIDPGHFIDYYETQGWVMKNGRKMKDWKAAVRNWTRREAKEIKPVVQKKVIPFQDFEQRDYSDVQDDMMAKLAAEIEQAKKEGRICT